LMLLRTFKKGEKELCRIKINTYICKKYFNT